MFAGSRLVQWERFPAQQFVVFARLAVRWYLKILRAQYVLIKLSLSCTPLPCACILVTIRFAAFRDRGECWALGVAIAASTSQSVTIGMCIEHSDARKRGENSDAQKLALTLLQRGRTNRRDEEEGRTGRTKRRDDEEGRRGGTKRRDEQDGRGGGTTRRGEISDAQKLEYQ